MKLDAEKILCKVKEQLKEEFPSLIYPLNMLGLKKIETKAISLCTDGESILYSPSAVQNSYQRRGYVCLKTEMMHILLHGILGHLDMDGFYKDRKLLWAVMDLEVNLLINRLIEDARADLDYVSGTRMWEDWNDSLYGMDIYYHRRGCNDFETNMFRTERSLRFDDHRFWSARTAISSADTSNHENSEDSRNESKERRKQIWETSRNMLGPLAADRDGIMKTLGKQCGKDRNYSLESGGEGMLVEAAETNENSYQQVLREFFKMKEDQRENPDAMDRTLYQYGLELYGNVPLIEPPDSEEQLKLNTICLALDSSGSCSDEIAREFLRETCNLFRDIKTISDQCEVYFFVCDTEIEQEEHFESLKEWMESDWESVELYGWGGTSFVPVFERIQRLQDEEDKTIDCLIYLTDSWGDCVEEEPDYPVFFALPSEQVNEDGELEYMSDLPEWIRFVGLGSEG